MTKTSAWATLGWTTAFNAVWAAAMTAATLFLVVLGAVANLAVSLVLDRGYRGLGWLVGLAGSTAGAVTALVTNDLLTGVDLLTVLA
jgi:hypothetical protein